MYVFHQTELPESRGKDKHVIILNNWEVAIELL